VLRVYVELGLNVRMLVDDLCVNVYLDIRGTRTLAVSRENVMKTQIVDLRELAKIISVWTRVLYPAEAGLIVVYRTTWQSVDVPGDTQEIPSEAVGNSLERRSVHLVESTLTAR